MFFFLLYIKHCIWLQVVAAIVEFCSRRFFNNSFFIFFFSFRVEDKYLRVSIKRKKLTKYSVSKFKALENHDKVDIRSVSFAIYLLR